MNEWTDKWLQVFQDALNLRHEEFEKFMFAVGYHGTDEERYKKAKAVLKILYHRHAMNVFTFNFTETSKDDFDGPMDFWQAELSRKPTDYIKDNE